MVIVLPIFAALVDADAADGVAVAVEVASEISNIIIIADGREVAPSFVEGDVALPLSERSGERKGLKGSALGDEGDAFRAQRGKKGEKRDECFVQLETSDTTHLSHVMKKLKELSNLENSLTPSFPSK